ncbi:MAG: L-lysine 6-transaminase [Acidobacteriota bacterium]
MEKSQLRVGAAEVHGVIGRHMQAEGLDLVVDFEKSRGVHLYDSKRGEFFLDLFSFFATLPLGFNYPRMTSRETVEELGRVAVHKPSNSDVYSREMAEFVEAFARLAKPDFMRYMFFVEGGAVAVENALKTAFDWKVRKNLASGSQQEKGFKVIHFHQAFHGRSGYTLSLTNTADPRKIQYFPKFNWPRILNPKCIFPLESENLARVQRLEEEAVSQIRAVIEEDPADVACLILEPIQGEGGDNHFRPEFHQRLRQICDEHEILFIYDEVQTGFGATGRMWAYEYYARPDILCFGKKSQVCGILVSSRVDEAPDNVFHVPSRINSTWGGNLVDMVRCRICLDIYREDKLVENSCQVGEVLLSALQDLQDEFSSLVSNVRGKGLFCAFDLPDTDFRNRFRKSLFDRRLVILPCGERSIRFRPALTIGPEEIYQGVDIMRQTLKQI